MTLWRFLLQQTDNLSSVKASFRQTCRNSVIASHWFWSFPVPPFSPYDYPREYNLLFSSARLQVRYKTHKTNHFRTILHLAYENKYILIYTPTIYAAITTSCQSIHSHAGVYLLRIFKHIRKILIRTRTPHFFIATGWYSLKSAPSVHRASADKHFFFLYAESDSAHFFLSPGWLPGLPPIGHYCHYSYYTATSCSRLSPRVYLSIYEFSLIYPYPYLGTNLIC